MVPDDRHGDERNIVMQDIVDAAAPDGSTVEQTWKNMQETMARVVGGKLKSKAWEPKKKS